LSTDAVKTATTPGMPAAAAVSTDVIVPRATSLRTNAECSVPGKTMSST
jgi:hypothetical protein